MGRLEESGRQKTRRKNLRRFVLGAIGIAGILAVAAVAPNVLGAMGKLGIIPTGRQKEIINRARDRLIKQGLLERFNGQLRLTQKGSRELRRQELMDFKTVRKKRWDGKWRVLIFDVPEYRKGLREKIRRTLISIGFIRLQDSVWIFPYDCEDLIALLKTDFRAGKNMLYMIVDELESDAELKKSFGLH